MLLSGLRHNVNCVCFVYGEDKVELLIDATVEYGETVGSDNPDQRS